MATFIFTNNASTTLAAGIGPSATSIQLAAGTGAEFPNPAAGQQFTLTLTDAATGLINEICYCTARATDVLTVARAQEGTTAKTWAIGDNAGHFLTAGTMAAFAQSANIGGQYAVDTGTANAMVAVLSPAPASLSAMVGVRFGILKGSNTNTDSVTLNLNGLGAKNVVFPNDTPMLPGQLVGDGFMVLVWDGTDFELQSLNDQLDPSQMRTAPAYTVLCNLSGSPARPIYDTLVNLAAALGIFVPTGAIMPFAGNGSVPSGFLLCDGSAVSRSAYSALFSALGITYGPGNGSTTFNVPDLRAMFIRGLDDGRGIDTGRGLGTNQAPQTQSHKHNNGVVTTSGSGSIFPYGIVTVDLPGSATNTAHTDANSPNWQGLTSDGQNANGTNALSGGSGSVSNALVGAETRPANVAMNYIIKT